MANNTADNVKIAKPKTTGTIFSLPLGATVPQNASDPLPPTAKNLGYISEDGIENTYDREGEAIIAFGGDEVAETDGNDSQSFSFTALETNEAVLREHAGDDNVTVDAQGRPIVVRRNSNPRPRKTYVKESWVGDVFKREVIDIGRVSSVDSVTETHTSALQYGFTIKKFPNANGDKSVEYYHHPGPPTITGATPSGATTGSEVTITGTGFTGATAVTIGGTAATSFTVQSATSLKAVVPTGTAGSAPIVVTTPLGSNSPFAYTRGGEGS